MRYGGEENKLHNARLLLELLLESIEMDNRKELSQLLEMLPLMRMKDETYNLTLVMLLRHAYMYGRKEICTIVIQFFADSNPMEGIKPINTSIFTIRGISDEVLKFADQHGNVSRHLTHLMDYGEGPEVVEACVRLQRIYGLQSEEVYRALLDEVERQGEVNELHNLVLHDYFSAVLGLVSSKVQLPSWLLIPEEGEPLPTHKQLQDKLEAHTIRMLEEVEKFSENDEQLVDLLISAPKMIPTIEMHEVEEAKKKILEQLASMKIKGHAGEWRLQMLHRLVEDTFGEDPLAFKVLGPAHPLGDIAELNSRSHDPCSRYGGCRLMTCYEFENEDSITSAPIDEELCFTRNYDLVDWFGGKCDLCHKRIEWKHVAVRMPQQNGGWKGCYCSWDHVRQDLRTPPNKRIVEWIDLFERQYLHHGIYHRSWDEVETTLPSSSLLTPNIILQGIEGEGGPNFGDDVPSIESLMMDIPQNYSEMLYSQIGTTNVPTPFIQHIHALEEEEIEVPSSSFSRMNIGPSFAGSSTRRTSTQVHRTSAPSIAVSTSSALTSLVSPSLASVPPGIGIGAVNLQVPTLKRKV